MPPEVLRELVRLVRVAEPDGKNVGLFVSANAAELAPLLRTTEGDLLKAADHVDELVVPAVRKRLDRALEEERQQRKETGRAAALEAAVQIGRTARWHERGVVLDVDLLLGALVADTGTKHVVFTMPDATVALEAALLRRARILGRTYIDLAAFADADGLHFRWKAGRGFLNLRSRHLSASEMQAALVVYVPPPMRPQMPAFAGAVASALVL